MLRRLCRKASELSEINTTTMHTIPTINNLANKPSNVSTFTTGRSLGSPRTGRGLKQLRRANQTRYDGSKRLTTIYG